MTVTSEEVHVYAIVGGFCLSMVTGISAAFYAKISAAKEAQRVQDRLDSLEDWKKQHQQIADEGMHRLTQLQTGISAGAADGIQRLEKSIEKVLQATGETAENVARLSGTVEALAGSVGMLVSKGMKGGTR